MLTKQEVITRLSSGQRDLTVLQAVVAAKIEKRAQKGQDLHMYTLDLSSLQSKTKRESNVILADLVEDLYQQIPEHAQPMRFQLLIKTSAVHWTAVDVEMSADKVLFLNIDAAGDLSSSIINTLFMQIREKYPNPDLSVCYRLMHEPLSEDSLLPKAIQFGPAGCSTFAMDHLFHTANIDVFRLLEQREETMLNTDNPFDHDDGHPASVFNARNMPPELAVIYRNTESKQVFSVLSEELKSQVINKKGQTLQQAEYKNSWPIWHKNQIKMRNFAMENVTTHPY